MESVTYVLAWTTTSGAQVRPTSAHSVSAEPRSVEERIRLTSTACWRTATRASSATSTAPSRRGSRISRASSGTTAPGVASGPARSPCSRWSTGGGRPSIPRSARLRLAAAADPVGGGPGARGRLRHRDRPDGARAAAHAPSGDRSPATRQATGLPPATLTGIERAWMVRCVGFLLDAARVEGRTSDHGRPVTGEPVDERWRWGYGRGGLGDVLGQLEHPVRGARAGVGRPLRHPRSADRVARHRQPLPARAGAGRPRAPGPRARRARPDERPGAGRRDPARAVGRPSSAVPAAGTTRR